MRRLETLVLTALFALLSLGLANSALALAIEPPTPPGLGFTSNGATGVIAIRDIDERSILFQLVRVNGDPGAGVKVMVMSSETGLPILPNKVGTHFDTGVNIADGYVSDDIFSDSRAVFVFAQPFDRMATDPMKIGFASDITPGDTIFFDFFDAQNQLTGSASATVVPEPGTALLLGLGMGGLALAGRRRS
jgi:hypothetical protein